MPSNAQRFRTHLARSTGLSDAVIEAAWPDWWSEAADASPSAQAELRFSVARQLGLDPRSLLDDDEAPRFVWDDSAKYKNFTGDSDRDRPAITSFGVSLSRTLITAMPSYRAIQGLSVSLLRESVLATKPFVRLQDLVALLWGVGIPVIHLRVFPLPVKRMCAMAVSVGGGRYAVLLAKDSNYPATTAFHLAHEIGHIALGHIEQNSAVVDMEDPAEREEEQDEEELAADRFALELLTGDPDFAIEKQGQGRSGRQLAKQAMDIGPRLGIEPGSLALCYGHTTGDWPTAQSALSHIYATPSPVWSFINKIAAKEINWDLLTDDRASFLHAVIGGI